MSTFPDLIDLNDYVSRVRFLIDENSEKNFSTTAIVTSLNIKARALENEMLSLAPEAGFFEKTVQLNPLGTPPGTVANVQEYTLPSDFKRFKRVARGDTDIPLDPINLNERYVDVYSPYNPFLGLNPAFNIGPQFYYVTWQNVGFVPYTQGGIPILMVYIYTIALIQFGNDVTEIPIDYRDLMCIDAAIDCITKDEGSIGNLESMRSTAHSTMITSISDRQIQMPQGVTRTGRSW